MPEEPTTSDPVELTRLSFELGNRGDFHSVVGLWHSDYVWDLSSSARCPVSLRSCRRI
jgi:hypothetical protein